jgi:hypothetical protein
MQSLRSCIERAAATPLFSVAAFATPSNIGYMQYCFTKQVLQNNTTYSRRPLGARSKKKEISDSEKGK